MERPLFWHQGLFLQPQHFQIKDQYDQALLTPYNRFIVPHFWGIGEMEIHQAALGNHSFEILNGQFVFPDTTYVVLPDNAVIEARSFEDARIEDGRGIPVYLGIRKWNEAGENVTVLSSLQNISDVNTRFVTLADAEEAADYHQNGPPAQVKRLYYVLKLFWETEKEIAGDYELIQIGNIDKSGDETVLSARFIPPCISIAGSDLLYKLVREIRDQVAARARQLEAYKRDRGIHAADFGARDMVFFLALRSLNRYVPLLAHLTEPRKGHPWPVYGVLRQLAGELSAFSSQVSVDGELGDGTILLPPYDHRNLWACFSGAQKLIARLLDEITAGPEYVIQLLYDETYFSAELPPSIFEGRNRYYLVFETEADPEAMVRDTENIAKLGTRELLPILIARALPGIKLQHNPVPPQELPRRAHSLYFQIDHNSDHWAQVKQENNLALYWDSAPQDLKIELMVVERT